MSLTSFFQWFSGGEDGYMTLRHCMNHDYLWISLTISLDALVAGGYILIASHWWKNQKRLDPANPAYKALGELRNIFLFCGLCGYAFIPVKMVWPAWRLYDMFMMVLVYTTWRFALRSRNLQVVYTELSKTKQLQADLDESRAQSKQKSFFLNAVSHDLRTPLNGLVLQTAVAEMCLEQNDTQMLRESLQQMKATANVAAELLSSFLELGRMDWSAERTHTEQFGLDQVLHDSAARLHPEANRKKLTLRTLCADGLEVSTDKMKLTRILDNLLNNALKYTESGHVELSTEVRGDELRIHVSDTGAGISADHIPHLFDEFYQVNNGERNHTKGFGMGLAIARRLADQLGARILVESEVGRGSRFTIALRGSRVAPSARPAERLVASSSAVAAG